MHDITHGSCRRKEAQEQSGKPAEAEPSASQSSGGSGSGDGSSYYDKIRSGFSLKVDGSPALRDESKPKEEPKPEPSSKPSFSFGGLGEKADAPKPQAMPEKAAEPSKPAAPPPSESKPSAGAKGEEPKWWEKLDFSEPKVRAHAVLCCVRMPCVHWHNGQLWWRGHQNPGLVVSFCGAAGCCTMCSTPCSAPVT